MDLLERLCCCVSHERVAILVEGKAQGVLDRCSGVFSGVPFEKLHERADCCDAAFGAVVSASVGAHSPAEQVEVGGIADPAECDDRVGFAVVPLCIRESSVKVSHLDSTGDSVQQRIVHLGEGEDRATRMLCRIRIDRNDAQQKVSPGLAMLGESRAKAPPKAYVQGLIVDQ